MAERDELTVIGPATLNRVAVEGVGERDQVWVHVVLPGREHATYFNYIDEKPIVIRSQLSLLETALASGLKVLLHVDKDGKRFHAVTACRDA